MEKRYSRGPEMIQAFCSCGWGVEDFKMLLRCSLPFNCPDCDAVLDDEEGGGGTSMEEFIELSYILAAFRGVYPKSYLSKLGGYDDEIVVVCKEMGKELTVFVQDGRIVWDVDEETSRDLGPIDGSELAAKLSHP